MIYGKYGTEKCYAVELWAHNLKRIIEDEVLFDYS